MYQRRFSRRLVAKQKNTMQLDEQLEGTGVREDTKMLENRGQHDCKATKQLGVASKQVCKDNQQVEDMEQEGSKDPKLLEDLSSLQFGCVGGLEQEGSKDTQQLEDREPKGFKDTQQLENRGQQEIEFREQLGVGGCEEGEELETSRQLRKRIKYDCKLDEDAQVNVMKLDENKNVLHPCVAVENDLRVPSVSVKECIMVHKPEKCEDNDNNSREHFLKGLFSTVGTSVSMNGVSMESRNSVDGDCPNSMDNSYNTSIENDLVVKRFKNEDFKVENPEKLEVTEKSNQDIVEIEVYVAKDIKSDLEFGSFTGREDWRQNLRSVENTNKPQTLVGKNPDTPVNGEQVHDAFSNGDQGNYAFANWEQVDDALTNGDQGDEALAIGEQVNEALAIGEQVNEALAIGEQVDEALAIGEQVDEALAIGEQVDEALAIGEQVDDTFTNGNQGDEALTIGEQVDEALANGDHGDEALAIGEQGDEALAIGAQIDEALANGDQGDAALAIGAQVHEALTNGDQADEALAIGEQDDVALANGDQDEDTLANTEQEDFFENRFCEGFHKAMGMAVVDMQNEKKPSRVSRRNVPRNSQIFGVSELSWRLGTICCDSVHTDVTNHVASHRHEVKKFKCNGCKIKLSDSQCFLDHINTHHSVTSSSLKCLENKCRLLFPTTFSLKIHQQEYHVEETERIRMKCNTCSKKQKEDANDRGEPRGDVFVPHIGEHALKVHRELWI